MKLENGFVKIMGASDLEDSSMAAGMCALFEYPIEFDILNHLWPDGMYRRCRNSRYLFSRDQALCLVAGLYKRGFSQYVGLERVDGKDLFNPAARGHIKRCQSKKAWWFQDFFLRLEILAHALVTPLGEPNQLICMMMVHPDRKYLKLWCYLNSEWRKSINLYWRNWRGEPELAELMIIRIEEALHDTNRISGRV